MGLFISLKENKGGVMLTAIAIVFGILAGLFLSHDFTAEAILGGLGNVTDTNNPHNFSKSSAGIKATEMTQVCIFCHTPHHAKADDTSLLNAPLWNHKLSTQTYKVKAAGNFSNGVLGWNVTLLSSPMQSPDGSSKLCLSCHDGTVAIGAVYSRASEINMDTSTACITSERKLSSTCSSYIGNDLSTKHVVSVPMNDALVSASLNNCINGWQTHKLRYPWTAGNANVVLRPTTAQYPTGNMGIEGTSADAQSGGTGRYYKAGYNYGVQCSTCHDPHLWANTRDTNTPGAMFIVDKFDSLCKACHVSCN